MKNKYFTRVMMRLGYDLTFYLPLQALPIVNGAEGEPKAFDASDVDITDVRMQGVGETGKGKPVRFETLYNYVIVHAPKQTKTGDVRIWVEGTYGQVCINAEIVATIAKNDGEILAFLDPYVSPIVGDCAWIKGVAPMPIKFTNVGDIPTGVGMMVMSTNLPNLQVSTDGEEWRDVTEEEFNTMPFDLLPNTSIYFRGNNPNGLSFFDGETPDIKLFVFSDSDADISVSGDVMSLINHEKHVSEIPEGSCFAGLFGDIMGEGSPLVDASELFAIIKSITPYAFYAEFMSCAKLVNPPSIICNKATVLAPKCYDSMFYGCESLVSAPALPATVLALDCYANMFYGCESLVKAPSLTANVLDIGCYSNMFHDCRGLTFATSLPAITLVDDCYNSMFQGCINLVSAPALPATVLALECYVNMFSGCTSLAKAPTLPATVLASHCYEGMFFGCTSLTKAPALPATVLATNCYYEMFTNCRKLAHIEMMALTIPTGATHNWVNGVAANGTFVKNKNATWEYVGVNGVPAGWEVIKK